MEMLSSLRGDKHEFCLVIIELRHESKSKHEYTVAKAEQ